MSGRRQRRALQVHDDKYTLRDETLAAATLNRAALDQPHNCLSRQTPCGGP
jgi:hypothetical protein